MSLNRGRKLKIILTAFVICGAFLYILQAENASAYHSTSTYDKPANGTLSANEWNNLLFDNSGSRGVDNLFGDFVNTWLPAKMNGPLGIATSSPADSGVMLDVNGYVRATGFIGPMASFLSARSVSSGEFGFSTGGGNYTFGVTNPGNVGIGVALPQYNLDVAGKTRFGIGEDPDAFVIRSNPDAVNRLRVDNDIKNVLIQEGGGLVGIGTSTPNALLDVNGLIKMRTGTIIANEDVINKGYLDSALALATSSVITQVATSSFWQGSLTGNVWNANTGNIGIGTTNPGSKLEISGAGGSSVDGILRLSMSNGGGIRITDTRSANQSDFLLSATDYVGGATAGTFAITDKKNNATRILINSAGNVGIGTTNPLVKLNVVFPDGALPLDFRQRGILSEYYGNGAYFGKGGVAVMAGGTKASPTAVSVNDVITPVTPVMYDGTNWRLGAFAGTYVTGVTNATSIASELRFYTGTVTGNAVAGAYTGLTQKMVLDKDGNVGIGTTSPLSKLHVYDTGVSDTYITLENAGGAGSGFRFLRNPTGYDNGFKNNAGVFYITTSQNNFLSENNRLSVDYNGNVGIGGDITAGTDFAGASMVIKSGNVGIGTTAPNDRFSIGNSGSAPAGSSNTGHNYTSTYLSADDYALANYGLVKTLISAATSSSALWGGTTGGNIWSLNSANVGIGTTNPTSGKLQIGPGGSATTLAFNLGAMNTFASIQTYNSSLSLNSAGNNVGIGTTSPVNKLDVVGNQGLSGTLVLNNPVASQNGYNIKNLTIMSDPFYNSAIIGYDYDALVNADKKYTITFTGGFVGSNAALLFDGNTGSAISSTAATTGTIEVNLINMQHYFYALTLNSPWGTGYGFSSSFLIEKYYDPSSSNGWDSNCDNSEGDLVWATISDVTGFSGSQYVTRTGLSNGICRIRVTFRDFTGTTSQIQVGDLSLYQFYYGYKGLSAKTNGDTLFGDYDFSDSVIRVHIDNSTGNSFFNGGNFGVGTTAPNDKFSIGSGGGIAAPAGSSNTGHNYTSTYLSSDDYALANYGIVKTMIASATSTMPGLWSGTLGGAIWSANSGYVGIGVSAPASKLDLAGDFRITPSGSSGGILFTGVNATRLYSDASTAGLWMINSTSSRMFLGTTWNYDAQVTLDYTPGSVGAGAGRLVIGQTSKNAANYTHGITSLYTNGLERIRINVDGNVGIGTTNPGYRLSLGNPTSDTNASKIAIFENVGGGNYFYGLGLSGSGSDAGLAFWGGTESASPTSTNVNLFIKRSSGNVGIGTTNPADIMTINKNTTSVYEGGFGLSIRQSDPGTPTQLSFGTLATYSVIQSFQASAGWSIRPLILQPMGGRVGIGTTVPNDTFSIGNSGSAPAGSSNTGHNYTNTYLSSDDYALTNYGVVKTLIASATSSSGLWMGVKNGNIWNGDAGVGNVGIGTTTPGAKLDIFNNTLTKSLNILSTGSYDAVDSTYGIYVLNNRGGYQNNPSRYGGYFESQSYTSSSNYNYGVAGVANKIGGYGNTATGVLGIGRHTYSGYATVASSLIGVQGQVDFTDDSVALTNTTFGASFYANASIPANKVLTTYYGLYLTSPTGAGTITNKFGVYQSDSGSRNYFAGNVGIGVSNPSNALTAGIARNETTQSTSAVLNIFNSDTTANNMANIAFGQNGIGSNGFSRLGVIYSDRTSGSEDQDMFFGTIGAGTYGERMRIASTGNVGIGSSNPVSPLEINKNTGAAVNSLLTLTYSNVLNAGGSIDFNTSPSFQMGKIESVVDVANYASLRFYTRNNGPLSEWIRITGSGNVGIGTTAPNDRFSIGNAGSAPAGSSNTGHNYTNTYLSSDDYALANYGLVKTLISAATSSSALWGGTTGGNIWNLNNANIGIGTTTPQAKLDIAGSNNGVLRFSNTSSGSAHWEFRPFIIGVSNGGFSIRDITNSSDRIVISDVGNVGIGTSTPLAKLQINSSGGGLLSTGLIVGSNNGALDSAMLSLTRGSVGRISGVRYQTNNADTWFTGMYYNGGSSQSNFGIGTDYQAANQKIVIDTAGRVGIGTTTPGTALEIAHNAWTTYGLRLRNTYSTGHTWDLGDGIDAMGTFSIYDRTAPASRFVITAAGNVGINTVSPYDIFSIGNAGSAPAGSANTGHNYTNTYLSSDDYALANYGIVKTLIASATSTMTGLWGGAVGGNIWSLNGGGNVGIGTTTPGALLDVIGTVRANSFVGPLNGSVIADNVTSGFFGNNYGGGTYTFGGWPSLLGGGSSYNIYLASTGSHIIHAPQLYVRQDDSETSIINTKIALDIHNDDGGQNTYSTLAFSSREASGAGNSVALAGISGWKISAGTANAWSQGGLKFWVKDNGALNEAMTINQVGNVGIGTTTPSSPLNIVKAISGPTSGLLSAKFIDVTSIFSDGNGNSGAANYYSSITGSTNVSNLIGYYSNINGTNTADTYGMYLNLQTAGSGNNYGVYTTGESKNYFSGSVGIGTTNPGEFKLKVVGDVAITGALLTQTGSDFAEEFKAPTALEPGTVVVMGDEGYKSVKACENSYDKTVVGIVSDNPSIIAGRTDIDNKNPEKVIVAMMGVVKVKVTSSNGPINKGDLLTTSEMEGFAMRAKNNKQGTIIGKALEDLNAKTGEIKVLVNLQ